MNLGRAYDSMTEHVSETPVVHTFNRSAVLGTASRESHDAIREFKIFNVTVTSLAFCILAFTGVFFSISCHRRRRQQNQARAYESAVGRDQAESPVDVKMVKRTHSLCDPLSFLRKQDARRDQLGIYFIYSNPMAVEEDDTVPPEGARIDLQRALTRRDHSKDASSGITLDQSMFYMQL